MSYYTNRLEQGETPQASVVLFADALGAKHTPSPRATLKVALSLSSS